MKDINKHIDTCPKFYTKIDSNDRVYIYANDVSSALSKWIPNCGFLPWKNNKLLTSLLKLAWQYYYHYYITYHKALAKGSINYHSSSYLSTSWIYYFSFSVFFHPYHYLKGFLYGFLFIQFFTLGRINLKDLVTIQYEYGVQSLYIRPFKITFQNNYHL